MKPLVLSAALRILRVQRLELSFLSLVACHPRCWTSPAANGTPVWKRSIYRQSTEGHVFWDFISCHWWNGLKWFVMGCNCNDCNGACVCPSSQRQQHWLSPRARERDIRTKLNKMNALFIAVAMNMMNGTWAPDGARGGVASKVHIIVGLKWLKYQKHRGILSSCTGEPANPWAYAVAMTAPETQRQIPSQLRLSGWSALVPTWQPSQ